MPNMSQRIQAQYLSAMISDIWVVPREMMSLGICGQRRPRSACASAQSNQGLRCPLPESLGTTVCFNGGQKPG